MNYETKCIFIQRVYAIGPKNLVKHQKEKNLI